MLAEAAEEEAVGTDIRERQVGGDICRTMHENDFKNDSPVPYFRLYFVLTPKYVWAILFLNAIQQARMVAGGETGVRCRTTHKKDLKSDSPVLYLSFVL